MDEEVNDPDYELKEAMEQFGEVLSRGLKGFKPPGRMGIKADRSAG